MMRISFQELTYYPKNFICVIFRFPITYSITKAYSNRPIVHHKSFERVFLGVIIRQSNLKYRSLSFTDEEF